MEKLKGVIKSLTGKVELATIENGEPTTPAALPRQASSGGLSSSSSCSEAAMQQEPRKQEPQQNAATHVAAMAPHKAAIQQEPHQEPKQHAAMQLVAAMEQEPHGAAVQQEPQQEPQLVAAMEQEPSSRSCSRMPPCSWPPPWSRSRRRPPSSRSRRSRSSRLQHLPPWSRSRRRPPLSRSCSRSRSSRLLHRLPPWSRSRRRPPWSRSRMQKASIQQELQQEPQQQAATLVAAMEQEPQKAARAGAGAAAEGCHAAVAAIEQEPQKAAMEQEPQKAAMEQEPQQEPHLPIPVRAMCKAPDVTATPAPQSPADSVSLQTEMEDEVESLEGRKTTFKHREPLAPMPELVRDPELVPDLVGLAAKAGADVGNPALQPLLLQLQKDLRKDLLEKEVEARRASDARKLKRAEAEAKKAAGPQPGRGRGRGRGRGGQPAPQDPNLAELRLVRERRRRLTLHEARFYMRVSDLKKTIAGCTPSGALCVCEAPAGGPACPPQIQQICARMLAGPCAQRRLLAAAQEEKGG